MRVNVIISINEPPEKLQYSMSGTKGVKRVKSGCITCRIRRVKCDEEHPHCRRCTSTGRTCDGYSTLPFSRKDLQEASRSVSPRRDAASANEVSVGVLPRLVTDPAFEDLVEKRYFQFFRQRSVASNNNLIDTRFWHRLVLQACHTEPAIRHAVLALSSLHQLDRLPRGSYAAAQHEAFAERQHQKALAAAQHLISASASQPHDFDKILTACVIFILFESVRGDYRAAAMHMSSGRAILAQHSARLRQPGRRKDLIEIEHALARLDLTSVFFQDESSPYLFSLMDFYRTDPVIMPYAFTDIPDAQTCLVDLVRWLLVLDENIEREGCATKLAAMAKIQAEKVRCGAQLERWQEHFRTVLDQTEKPNKLVVLNLEAWYAFAMLVVKADTYGLEIRYDAFMPDFDTIISCAAQIAVSTQNSAASSMFSYEVGYLGPLYFAATRCRDPTLRRQAIAILRDYPRQEGVLESVAAANIATAWMEAEEDGLDVRCAADVPEHRRLVSTDTRVDVQKKEAVLGLNRQSHESQKPNVLVTWKGDEDQGSHRSPATSASTGSQRSSLSPSLQRA